MLHRSNHIQLRKAGVSIEEAATYAHNMTVNFNRRGEWGATLNSLYMFANAGIQGTHRVVQAMRRSPRVRRRVYGIVLSTALLDALNRAMAPDDEDGRNAYDAIPAWVRERNLIFMIPGTTQYLSLPLPYGFNLAAVLGSNATAWGQGERPISDVFAEVIAAGLGSFNPTGSDPTVSVAQFVSPTLADPAVQLAENKTWFGAPIVPDGGSWDKRPDSQKHYRSVSTPAKWTAHWLNKVSGGDKWESGLIDVSPESLEYIGEFIGGGLGRFLERSAKTAGSVMFKGELPEINDAPILRRFYGRENEARSKSYYYEARESLDLIRKRMTAAREAGDKEHVVTLRRRHGSVLRLEGLLKETEKLRRKINGRLDDARGQDRRDLEQQMLQAMRRFNLRWSMATRSSQAE